MFPVFLFAGRVHIRLILYLSMWRNSLVKLSGSRDCFVVRFLITATIYLGFSGGSEVKACNAGDLGSIPGLGRSPGEGNGTPLQYPCLENPMDGGAWWATAVHGVSKSRTRLSDFTFTIYFLVCVCMLSCFSHVQFFVTLWTIACQSPLFVGFSRQEYSSG